MIRVVSTLNSGPLTPRGGAGAGGAKMMGGTPFDTAAASGPSLVAMASGGAGGGAPAVAATVV